MGWPAGPPLWHFQAVLTHQASNSMPSTGYFLPCYMVNAAITVPFVVQCEEPT